MLRKSNTKFLFTAVYFLGIRRLTSSPCVVHAYTTVDIQTCRVYMYCIYSIYVYIHFYTWYTHFFKIYLFISNALKM